MPQRFFLADCSNVSIGDHLTTPPELTHYLQKVLRIKPGAALECFDGAGGLVEVAVDRAEKKEVVLQVTHTQPTTPRHAPQIALALGLLKGQAMDRAIQQATEAGACSIALLTTDRVNVKHDAKRQANRTAHWEKIVQGACEQCGQLYIPALYPTVSVDAFIGQSSARQSFALDLTGDPWPRQWQPSVAESPSATGVALTMLIGPEGGWSQRELALFEQADIARYKMADFTLRAETAPAVALTLAQHTFAP